LQARDEQEHIVADGAPHGDDDDGQHRFRSAQPIDRGRHEVQLHQVLIDNAVVRVENNIKDDRHNRCAEDRGQKDDRPERVSSLQLAVENNGEDER
jgi:hypothetical protein